MLLFLEEFYLFKDTIESCFNLKKMMKGLLPKKYNQKLFLRIFLGVFLVTAIVFLTAIFLFNYQLTSWDMPGCIIALPLFTHFIYLLVAEEEDLEF